MNFSALCTILVTFGPVTPEFTLLTKHLLWRYGKYRHITYRSDYFGSHIGGDDYPNIRSAVGQRTLLWQPVKFGRCSQKSHRTIFTICFGVQQWIGRS